MAFVPRNTPDIMKQLQHQEGFAGLPNSFLLERARKVYNNQEEVEQQEKDQRMQRKSQFQAPPPPQQHQPHQATPPAADQRSQATASAAVVTTAPKKQVNLAKVFQVLQKEDETPDQFYERLVDTFDSYTPLKASDPENQRTINLLFVTQSFSDVKKRLQQVKDYLQQPTAHLLELARKVYSHRTRTRRKEQNQEVPQKSCLLAKALTEAPSSAVLTPPSTSRVASSTEPASVSLRATRGNSIPALQPKRNQRAAPEPVPSGGCKSHQGPALCARHRNCHGNDYRQIVCPHSLGRFNRKSTTRWTEWHHKSRKPSPKQFCKWRRSMQPPSRRQSPGLYPAWPTVDQTTAQSWQQPLQQPLTLSLFRAPIQPRDFRDTPAYKLLLALIISLWVISPCAALP